MHVPYPEQWASLSPSTDICEDIIGSYKSQGESALVERKTSVVAKPAPSLASLLIGKDNSADYVSIARTGNGAFFFEATSHGEIFGSRSVAATCDTDKLSVPGTEQIGPFNDWVVFGTEHHTVELHKAEDGTLAVNSVRGGYGLLLLVVPAGESKSNWYRYARADKP